MDAYGNTIPEAQITWSVADGAGTISDDGHLTAGTLAGTYERGVKVAAVLNGVSEGASATVTVAPDPLNALSTASAEVAAGDTRQAGIRSYGPLWESTL